MQYLDSLETGCHCVAVQSGLIGIIPHDAFLTDTSVRLSQKASMAWIEDCLTRFWVTKGILRCHDDHHNHCRVESGTLCSGKIRLKSQRLSALHSHHHASKQMAAYVLLLILFEGYCPSSWARNGAIEDPKPASACYRCFQFHHRG